MGMLQYYLVKPQKKCSLFSVTKALSPPQYKFFFLVAKTLHPSPLSGRATK